jgi:hypothetical protein
LVQAIAGEFFGQIAIAVIPVMGERDRGAVFFSKLGEKKILGKSCIIIRLPIRLIDRGNQKILNFPLLMNKLEE